KDRPDVLLAQLHDPSSPLYHQWLTPDEYGRRFGISDDDLADVTAWVQRRGLTIDEIPAGHGWINVSGSVADVERAFKTSIPDFAKIYNVNPLYTAGVNGTGQTIAIVGRTDIALGDVQYFRSFFGLPANDPVFVHNGTTPGNLGGGEEGEADLDVQWSGAVAPNATATFVITKSTSTTAAVDLSAQYIVN